MTTKTARYDVAIIGGGAAGLSAAQTLGRSRRSVVLIDAGEPRNATATAMHNFLSRDGMNPLELLARGRAELTTYGVDIVHTRAQEMRHGDHGFAITLANGNEVAARRLILAAGLQDQLPNIPGLAEHWGNDVLHCPFCHGWEVQDRRLGVIDSPMAVHQATMFTQWSPDVTLFITPGKVLQDEELEQLAALGVKRVEATIDAVLETNDTLTGVQLSDGTRHELDALVVMPTFDVTLTGFESLGLTAQDHPSGMGRYLPVPEGDQTETPGVWVTGNLAQPMAQVIMAAADGAGVGMRVQADLMQEDFAAAVARLQS